MSLVALYQHTWASRYLKLIDQHIETKLRETIEETVFVDEITANHAVLESVLLASAGSHSGSR